MTERKELIDLSDIKIGDDVEITIKGKVTSHQKAITLTTNKGIDTNFVYKHDIVTAHRILPAATKLEVGEILTHKHDTILEILHINKKKKILTILNQESDCTLKSYETSSPEAASYLTYYRKSGIPIDWDATFND